MNVVNQVGNICQDLELKMTNSGKQVLELTLAVKRPHTKDKTDFIPVQVWNHDAEFLYRYAKKGIRIGITGVMISEKYQDKDGNNRTAYKVVCSSVELLDSKGNSDQGTTTSRPQQNVAQSAKYDPSEGGSFDVMEDGCELPF